MNLPDFPWDLLAPYADKARGYKEGAIDMSQGTPVDDVPDVIQNALKAGSNSPGYPLTIGNSKLREVAFDWAKNELGITGDFDLLPTIGSKELVAWLPTFLQSKTVLYPKIAYPTYLVGAKIANAKAIAVDIDATKWPKSDLAWINSPSNPTGRVHTESELIEVISYAREKKSIIASDECYFSFYDEGVKPKSILSLTNGDNKGFLAVHSLSKRSNLAGYRAGLIIGDPQLIKKIREIRKHAGMLTPAPVQNAMIEALTNQDHVKIQVDRYNKRRKILKSALLEMNFKISESNSGLYIWCSNGKSDWEMVETFSNLGMIVTPGGFYGDESKNFIRIALTITDENTNLAANRIKLL